MSVESSQTGNKEEEFKRAKAGILLKHNRPGVSSVRPARILETRES